MDTIFNSATVIAKKITGVYQNVVKKITKGLEDIRLKISEYISSSATSLKDYIKFGNHYISKKFVLRVLIAIGLFVFVLANVIIPYLQGKLWTYTVRVNSNPYYKADGKVKVLDANDNLLYIGTMQQGRITGKGKVYDKGSVVYEGELKGEKYDGEGKLYKEGYLLYEGNFINNEYSGEGKLYYSNGNIEFTGTFEKGQYSQGCEYFEDGTKKYKGTYAEGQYQGKGEVYAQLTGDIVYSGQFSNNKYNGIGRLYNGKKLLYEGEFEDSQYNGKGKLYFDNGQLQYEGNFLAGNYCGEGSLYSQANNRLRYTGTFKDNVYDKKGVLYDEQTGRIKYDGEFSEGLYNGLGILYNSNHRAIYTGDFYYGEIDYESFCDESMDNVRKAFGNEDEITMLENSFLMTYKGTQVIFECSNNIEGKKPSVMNIKLLGTQQVHTIKNNESIEQVKQTLGTNMYTEYEFAVNQQEVYSFNQINESLKQGDMAYSIKYIFDASYIRAYSKNANGKVLYYEIGGI